MKRKYLVVGYVGKKTTWDIIDAKNENELIEEAEKKGYTGIEFAIPHSHFSPHQKKWNLKFIKTAKWSKKR